MGILSRFADIMSSNINAALDKLEDPSKMVDQYLRQAMEDFAEVKKETATIIANEKQAKRVLDEANQKVNEYTEMAKKAVLAGNDDDARKILAKKQDAEGRAATALNTYNAAKADADKMRKLYDKLATDIQSLQERRDSVKATNAVAKSQEAVNRVTSKFAAGSKGLEGFARMEAAVQAKLDTAEAVAELDAVGTDDMSEIEKKYSGSSMEVEDELAALKAELNKGIE